MVDQNDDRDAVVEGVTVLTYRQLWDSVNADARTFSDADFVVPLALPRGIRFVTRLMACWISGRVPLPLDPSTPPGRLDEILRLASFISRDQQPAYAISTSGSSGRAKLVEISWHGLLPMLRDQSTAFELRPGARGLWMLSPGFDASLSDVLTVLLCGATLVCAPNDAAERLPQLLEQHEITHLDLPPALLEIYRPHLFPPSLITLIVGGAPSNPEILRLWARRFKVVAVYGPTEATICSSLSVVDESWDAPYLGQPMGGALYRVVGDELCIGGPGVAVGYSGDPRATATAFWDEAGTRWYRTGDRVRPSSSPHGLIFAGRFDRQVQWRGQRLELEEIERRLRPYLGGDVTVTAGEELAVHWEGVGNRVVAERALRKALPGAWIPTRWHRWDRLPRLPGGKVQTTALQLEPRGVPDDSLERVRQALLMEHAGLAQRLLEGCTASITLSQVQEQAREMLRGWSPSRQGSGRALLLTGASGRLGMALLGPLSRHFEVLALQHSTPVPGVKTVLGDLTLPELGLQQGEWETLRGRVGAVLHLAARVEAGADLESRNAVGARALLTLAKLGAPLHLASSLVLEAVADGTVHGSYAQSKALAEAVWRKMKVEGTALRYGLLVGEPDARDLLGTAVRGLCDLGCYPVEGLELAFDVTPMDLAVEDTMRELLRFSGGSRTAPVTSGASLHLTELLDELVTLGVSLRGVPASEFFSTRADTASGVVAQMALGRLQGRWDPDWDLFPMTGLKRNGQGQLARVALRRYLSSVLKL